MIKCEALKDFRFSRFNELQNIKRYSRDEIGMVFEKDRFECSKEIVKYLSGENPEGEKVIQIIEVDEK